jgi:DNA topoisomerase IB
MGLMMKKEGKAPIFDTSQVRQRIETGKRAKWFQRKGSKAKNFKYFDSKNNQIKGENQLERIKSLVIPPAWKYVRISPSESSKIQAIGMDKTGRIQYIYHPKFAEKQQRKKFAKIEKFSEFLPNLRVTLDEFTPKKQRKVKRLQNEYEVEEKALLNLLQKQT